MHRFLIPLAFGLLLLSHATSSHAGVMISINSVTLTPGLSRGIEVWIESDAADEIQSFGAQFQLESSANGSLTFGVPDTSYLADSDYLFVGDSAANDSGTFDSVDTTQYLGDTYNAADFSLSGQGASLATSRLLTTLYVTASPTASAGAYKLSLNPGLTTFYDSNGSQISLNLPASGAFGTVTINALQAATVPEPASAVSLGVLTVLSLCLRRRTGQPARLSESLARPGR